MRRKLLMVVFAITLPVGMLLATQTAASARSPLSGTGTLSCTGAGGKIKLRPGWVSSTSNSISVPSTATFAVSFNGCSSTGGNITTKAFAGHLSGSVVFPTDYCSTTLGGTVALQAGSPLQITWNSQARIGPATLAPSSLSLTSLTGALTPGTGSTLTFSHQTVKGSFSAKTLSGQLDSYVSICSTQSIRTIPISGGYLSQP